MLRKQLSDSTSPPSSYHPAHLLLASSLLRLSLSLLPDHSQSQEALSLCVEGLEVLRGTQLTDSCLMTSLLTHRGGGAICVLDAIELDGVLWELCCVLEGQWVSNVTLDCFVSAVLLLQKTPLTERSEVTNQLLEAIRNTSDCKADYRYSTCITCMYVTYIIAWRYIYLDNCCRFR